MLRRYITLGLSLLGVRICHTLRMHQELECNLPFQGYRVVQVRQFTSCHASR